MDPDIQVRLVIQVDLELGRLAAAGRIRQIRPCQLPRETLTSESESQVVARCKCVGCSCPIVVTTSRILCDDEDIAIMDTHPHGLGNTGADDDCKLVRTVRDLGITDHVRRKVVSSYIHRRVFQRREVQTPSGYRHVWTSETSGHVFHWSTSILVSCSASSLFRAAGQSSHTVIVSVIISACRRHWL